MQDLSLPVCRLPLALGIVSFFIANGPSPAATLSWSGGSPTTGRWSDSQNWGFAGVPASGDTLIFPALQPRLANTNDISGLIINQIRFVGAGGGYAIRGNSLTLTNAIQATNSAGLNTLFTPIALNSPAHLINVGSGASLALAGTLSGSGGFSKNGPGTLALSGVGNTYAGNTTVNEGVLELASINAVRFGTLTIGDGWGGPGADIVRFTGNFPIYGGSGGSVVVIKSSGLLDQNGFIDDVGPIEMDGGRIETGAGTLTLFPPLTTYRTDPTNGNCILNGNFDVGNASPTFLNITNQLTINAIVQGGTSGQVLIKTGPSGLILTAANTYAATTVVQEGLLRPQNPLALGGTTSGTIVSNGASIAMNGTTGITNESLSLNGSGAPSFGALDATGAPNIWAGPITLTGSCTIWPFGGSATLRINGPISGTGSLLKQANGSLYLDGTAANTYSGTTTVDAGMLVLNKTVFDGAVPGELTVDGGVVRHLVNNQIGNGIIVTMGEGAVLDVNGFIEGVGGLDMTGATVQTGVGTLVMFGNTITTHASATASSISGNLNLGGGGAATTFSIADGPVSPDLLVSAVVQTGTSGIIKNGVGNLQLSAANTYSGPTTINNGFILINQPTGLGTAAAGTVLNGGRLSIIGTTVVAESLTNNSVNSILQTSGASGWGSNVVLNAELQVQVLSGTFEVSGVVSGSGDLTKTQPGTLRLSGSQANTYTGTTIVESGTLELGKLETVTAIPGNLVIGDGAGGSNVDVLRLLEDTQIADTSDVLVTSSGLFDLGIEWDVIDELSGTGNVTFGIDGWIEVGAANGTSTFDGFASGPGFGGGYTIRKLGTGTFTLTVDNTYLNQTRVDNGTLIVNGSQPQSPLYVAANAATAGGTGVVGPIRALGSLAPGNSPGLLTSSNLFFTSNGDYFAELTGPTPGTGYDQLSVRGTNNLGNAVLHVIPAFTTPVAIGQQFIIINNDAGEAITGTFNGLAEGAPLNAGFYDFIISYVGGDGNDVVLTLTNVPAATLGNLSSVSSGNGNSSIDPNECNLLSVVLTNETGTLMSGISATLASVSPNVIVSEMSAPFPDAAGNGTTTNALGFQLSTTTNFVCGTDINLLLSVTTSTHGAFVLPVVVRSGGTAVLPVRFDNSTVTNVPDIGAIESTNAVAAWSGPVAKIAVSLWLVAPFSSDVTLTLIAPNGASVDLSSGNGAGANFGSGNADASRAIFDDAAAVSITAGTSPFVGTFRPEGSLASLLAGNPVGNWRLRIDDGFGSGSPDTLRGWSLFLYPAECTPGNGQCELCPNVVLTSATGPSSPMQNGYVTPNGVPSVCGVAKSCPGTSGGIYPSESFRFQNGPSDACITVRLENPSVSHAMVAAAYTDAFNPTNVDKCVNYLGDAGFVVLNSLPRSFSFDVASNATFVVNLVSGGYGPYKLTVSGGDCRPVLNITAAGATQAVLDWSTAAAGYHLEHTNAVPGNAPVWPPVVGAPVIVNGRYTVTNQITGTNQFFRLRKPVTPEL